MAKTPPPSARHETPSDSLGEGRRALAPEHGRAASDPAHDRRAVAATPGERDHHPAPGGRVDGPPDPATGLRGDRCGPLHATQAGHGPLRPGRGSILGVTLSGRPLAVAYPRGAGPYRRAPHGGCGSLRGGLPSGNAEPAESYDHARRPLRAQRRVHDLEAAPRGREATGATGLAGAGMAEDATL